MRELGRGERGESEREGGRKEGREGGREGGWEGGVKGGVFFVVKNYCGSVNCSSSQAVS